MAQRYARAMSAPPVVELDGWRDALRAMSERGRVRAYFSEDDDEPPPALLRLRWLRELRGASVLPLRRVGVRAATRFERVAEALGVLSTWAERFDRALWPYADADASYIFALSDTDTRAAPGARASAAVLVERATYEDLANAAVSEAVGTEGRVRITITAMQVVDERDAERSALRHTVVRSVYARNSRQQLEFALLPEPTQFTDGVYESLAPAEAAYALRAQLKALLVGAPSSQREAARLDSADETIAGAIEAAVRRGRRFVDVFRTPVSREPLVDRALALLQRIEQFRDTALYQTDPRQIDVRPDPLEEPDYRLASRSNGEWLARAFRARFVQNELPGTDAWQVYALGWPQANELPALRANLAALLQGWFDAFYASAAPAYMQQGFRVYEASLAQEYAQEEANRRVYDPLAYDSEYDDDDDGTSKMEVN